MTMSEEEKYKPPKPDKADVAHAVTRSGLGAIPIAGTASVELLNAIVTPSLEKRKSEWMELIGEGLRELEQKMEIVLDSLQTNDSFTDIALEASQIAIRTSSKEKHEALRNAVLNSALPSPIEESMQRMFLSFVDTFTVWHIKLLHLFSDPEKFLQENSANLGNLSLGAPAHLVEAAYPELRGRRDIYDLVWKDLNSRALVNLDTLHIMMTGSGVVAKRTTEIADLFLNFIRSPFEDEP